MSGAKVSFAENVYWWADWVQQKVMSLGTSSDPERFYRNTGINLRGNYKFPLGAESSDYDFARAELYEGIQGDTPEALAIFQRELDDLTALNPQLRELRIDRSNIEQIISCNCGHSF